MGNKYSDIIKTIQREHHKYLKETLPEIHDLVYKILRVHYADSGKTLESVHKLFGRLLVELELIMIRRQLVLYPAIYDYKTEGKKEMAEILEKEVSSITLEYNIIVDVLEKLRIVTDDYTLPEDSCATFETTYKKLEELEKQVLNAIEAERSMYR